MTDNTQCWQRHRTLLAGIQIGTAFLEDILATVNNILEMHNPSSINSTFSYLPKRDFVLIHKEPYRGRSLYHRL